MAEPVKRETDRKRLAVRPLFSLTYLDPAGLQTFAEGNSYWFPSFALGLEASYRANDYWTAGLRFERFSFSRIVSVNSNENHYGANGVIAGPFVEFRFFESRPYKLGLAVMGGASFSTSVSAIVARERIISSRNVTTFVNYASSSLLVPAAEVYLPFSYFLNPTFSLNLDLGYRYLEKRAVALASTTADYVDSQSADLSASGPFLAFGAQFSF